MERTNAQVLAAEVVRLQWINNDPTHPNYSTNKANALERIELIETNALPSGSGFDAGCTVDMDASTGEKLVIVAPYHHMDEHGGYDGWETYEVAVRPSFDGITLKVAGGRKDHREYIAEMLGDALEEVCAYGYQRAQ